MAEASYGPAVTVSASYGAGGSVIAPRLAESLGVPFIDRLIAAGEVRSQEGLVEGERETTPTGRFLSYFARAATVGTVMAPDPDIEDDDAIREKAEAALRPVMRGAPAVVLGRAAAVVLASRPRTFHIRLDGPVERRLAWAGSFEGLDRSACAKRQSETDRARTQYVKRLYRRDPADPALYHLMIDPTVLGIEATIQVIVTAAEAYFQANP
jgi:cytidylate kinase